MASLLDLALAKLRTSVVQDHSGLPILNGKSGQFAYIYRRGRNITLHLTGALTALLIAQYVQGSDAEELKLIVTPEQYRQWSEVVKKELSHDIIAEERRV